MLLSVGSAAIAEEHLDVATEHALNRASGELGITGDFARGGGQGLASLKQEWSEAPPAAPTPVSFTAFGEDAPGLGRLAPRGSIGSHELSDLLT